MSRTRARRGLVFRAPLYASGVQGPAWNGFQDDIWRLLDKQ